MKALHFLLPAALIFGISTAATAQTDPKPYPANKSTVTGGTVGQQNGLQTGTTTQPSVMQNGAAIGNNRDVLSSGTGNYPAQPSVTERNQYSETRARRKAGAVPAKKKKMKKEQVIIETR